jgi:hypothetical protein
MKKLLLFATVMFATLGAFAQGNNVGIGTTTPDNTALLDLSSTTQGLLVPRLNTTQMNAINVGNAQNGLLIYNTDSLCFCYWNTTSWLSLCNGTGGSGLQGPTGPTGVQGPTGPAGANGVTGPSGADGTTGPVGPSGADGATGPTGPAGGPQGPTGPSGADGATGAAGPTGPSGADGATGPSGADGATGPSGANGATGPAGLNGATGATGATGLSAPTYSDVNMAFQTSANTINSATFAVLNGLTTTINVTGTAKLKIHSDGGFIPTTANIYDYVDVDVALFINGANPANGGYRRLTSGWDDAEGPFANWSMSVVENVAAGSYTINVQARRVGGVTDATVGGDNTSVLQGVLIVEVIYQ